MMHTFGAAYPHREELMDARLDLEHIGSANVALRACLPETRRALEEFGSVRTLQPDEALFRVGDASGMVMFPLSGTLQMSKTAARGRRQVLCNAGEAGCGGICMLAMPDRSPADIRGLTPGQVLLISREKFQELARRDPLICQSGWRAAAECMLHLSALIEALSFHKVSERVALMLFDATDRDGDMVRLTQSDVAAEVGTTREVVARCLASLQSSGVIRLGRGRISVLNRQKLQEELGA
jgi:CRP-like cAMP-binding protein